MSSMSPTLYGIIVSSSFLVFGQYMPRGKRSCAKQGGEHCRRIFAAIFKLGVDRGSDLCYLNIADKLPVWWNGRHRRLKISR